MKIDLTQLVTESRNPASAQIDTLTTQEMLQVINQQDQLVALAVEKTLPQIAQAVDAIAAAFAQGGRLIYMAPVRLAVWVFWMPVSVRQPTAAIPTW